MQCDDLRSPFCEHTRPNPGFPASQLHVMVWERTPVKQEVVATVVNEPAVQKPSTVPQFVTPQPVVVAEKQKAHCQVNSVPQVVVQQFAAPPIIVRKLSANGAAGLFGNVSNPAKVVPTPDKRPRPRSPRNSGKTKVSARVDRMKARFQQDLKKRQMAVATGSVVVGVHHGKIITAGLSQAQNIIQVHSVPAAVTNGQQLTSDIRVQSIPQTHTINAGQKVLQVHPTVLNTVMKPLPVLKQVVPDKHENGVQQPSVIENGVNGAAGKNCSTFGVAGVTCLDNGDSQRKTRLSMKLESQKAEEETNLHSPERCTRSKMPVPNIESPSLSSSPKLLDELPHPYKKKKKDTPTHYKGYTPKGLGKDNLDKSPFSPDISADKNEIVSNKVTCKIEAGTRKRKRVVTFSPSAPVQVFEKGTPPKKVRRKNVNNPKSNLKSKNVRKGLPVNNGQEDASILLNIIGV